MYFKDGEYYKTQSGALVKVLRHEGDCIVCSDGLYRYDRQRSTCSDNGRVTGTAHDYSHPENFDRLVAGLPSHEDDVKRACEELKKDTTFQKFCAILHEKIFSITE